MINLLLGPPGGGKSFEAVVFHILPALRKGRKVITNLPLNLDEIKKLNPKYLDLISLRQDDVHAQVEKNSWNPFHRIWDKHLVNKTYRPFASLADYGDVWRHPVNGAGALYVIDECHKALPAKGTLIEVEEWFAEHRHEFVDVLLITQSYGKVSKAITDACQVVYRVKKATALGSNNAYIRKVQDGLRGEVVNESIRRYKPEFFKYYKSHTRSDSAGAELAASDIVPFWKRWPVIGSAVCFLGVLFLLFSGKSNVNPMSSAQAIPQPQASALPDGFEPYSLPESGVVSIDVKQVEVKPEPKQKHPFEGLTLHIVGFLQSATKWRYTFSADQNGQPSFFLTQTHLEESGYTVDKLSDCSAKISYKDISFYAVCDNASVGISRSLYGNMGAL